MKDNISKAINRVDGKGKISGEAKYIDDVKFKDQLFAKTVRSEIPKGKIVSIKIPDLPNNYFVIDKNDIPGINRMRTVVSDHPIFAEDEVSYIGQPILLIVGVDREIINQIISGIKIEYIEEKPILSIKEAINNKAIFTEYNYSKGDTEKAFQEAEMIIEDKYQTGYQEHIYIEPQGIVAEFKNDKVNIYGSMQCPFYVEGAIQDVLGWEADRIRVIHSTTGGAFGGKEEFPSLLACQVAVASLKTNRPVKIIYDRNEDIISSTKRHPSVIHYKVGLGKNNKITVLTIDVNFNAGAFSGISPVVLQRGIFSATGVYNFQNLKVMGKNYKTNTVPCGAYRGFGSPQVLFGIEMLMINIAKRLKIKPLDFKKSHLLKSGDSTATNGTIRDEIKLPEMIKIAEKISNYEKYSTDKKKFKGMGISLFLHGCGFTGKGENDIKGKIILQKIGEKVFINVSSVEMGQGAETVLRKIVAYTLSIPIEHVAYETPDTSKVPDSGPTVASRTTMIVGGLLRSASVELKERWNEKNEITVTRIYKHPDFLKWDDNKFEGDAYPVYSYGVNVAEVEVDPVTFEIDVKNIYAVFDVGTVIDERALRGQMEGGMLQGIGWATTEVMNLSKGKLVQKNMTDYKIPTMKDIPKFQCEFVKNPYEFGPFGAKCAGELPLAGPPPAIAHAVSNALSIPIKKIPITPEDLMEAMKK